MKFFRNEIHESGFEMSHLKLYISLINYSIRRWLSSVFYENQYLSAGKEKVRLYYVPWYTVFKKEKV